MNADIQLKKTKMYKGEAVSDIYVKGKEKPIQIYTISENATRAS